jgi:hypothetical protein
MDGGNTVTLRLTIIALLLTTLTAGAWTQEQLMRRAYGVRGAAPSTDLSADLWHFWNPSVNGTNDMGSIPQNVTVYGTTATTTNGWEMGTVISNYAIVKGVISNEYNYTVCAWVNPNTTAMISAGANGCILSDDGNNSVYPQTRDFIFSYVYTSQKWRLLVFGNVGASVYSASALTASNAVNGVWQHISGVCDYASSNIFIYYNGVLSGSNSLYSAPYWLTPNKSSAGSSCFGQLSYLPTYGPTKYNGMIDKIRFYGTAKDAAFIQYLFNSEKASKGL